MNQEIKSERLKFDDLLIFRKKLQIEKNGMKKYFVDKIELRYEILLTNIVNCKAAFNRGDEIEKYRFDINNIDERFEKLKIEYIEYLNSVIDSNQSNFNYCAFLNKLMLYVQQQTIDKYCKQYFYFLINEVIINFQNRANFIGYSDDWKQQMREIAFDNCVKYLHNYREDKISVLSGGVTSAFSYVTQVLNTSFITAIKILKRRNEAENANIIENNISFFNRISYVDVAEYRIFIHNFSRIAFQTLFSRFLMVAREGKNSFKIIILYARYFSNVDEKEILGIAKNIQVDFIDVGDKRIEKVQYNFFMNGEDVRIFNGEKIPILHVDELLGRVGVLMEKSKNGGDYLKSLETSNEMFFNRKSKIYRNVVTTLRNCMRYDFRVFCSIYLKCYLAGISDIKIPLICFEYFDESLSVDNAFFESYNQIKNEIEKIRDRENLEQIDTFEKIQQILAYLDWMKIKCEMFDNMYANFWRIVEKNGKKYANEWVESCDNSLKLLVFPKQIIHQENETPEFQFLLEKFGNLEDFDDFDFIKKFCSLKSYNSVETMSAIKNVPTISIEGILDIFKDFK